MTTAALVAATVLAAVVVVRTWVCYLSAQGYVDYVEGLVLFHQTQAAAGENIYDPRFRAAPPYSIPLYGPIWYYLVAPFLGDKPSLLPGRAAALVCLLGLTGTAGVVLGKRYRAPWSVACAASVVWITTVGALQFGINNRVDALACLLGALAVVAATARFRGANCLVILLLLAAGFTKATAVVAPSLTVFVYLLWERRWREACAISIAAPCFALAVLALGDVVSAGNFSQCLIFSNVNPFQARQALTLIEDVCKQPVLPLGVVAAAVLLVDRHARAFALYGVLAAAFAVLSAAKVGSNTNYFIEPAWATAMCLGIAVARFRGHVRAPILYGLLACMVIQSAARATSHARYVQQNLADWPALEQGIEYYGSSGPVLTMEIGAQVHVRQQPYIADAHIITRLTEAGEFNQAPILDDLRQQRLAALILGEDATLVHEGHTNWTREMRLAVAQYYRPHEKLGRLTVYLPRDIPLDAAAVASDLGERGRGEVVQVSTFHANGQLAATSQYVDGKLHGAHTEWDLDGRKWCELRYERGRLNGTQRYFHSHGSLAHEVSYRNGVHHGDERRFTSHGECCASTAWIAGVPMSVRATPTARVPRAIAPKVIVR